MADSTKQKQSGLKVVEIQKLVDMLENSNLNDLELEMKGVKLRLSKGVQAPAAAPQQAPSVVMMPQQGGSLLSPPPVAFQPASAPPAGTAVEGGESAAETVSGKKTEAITSPMVGTFYRAPAPEAEPFVKIGDNVRKGQRLCIIWQSDVQRGALPCLRVLHPHKSPVARVAGQPVLAHLNAIPGDGDEQVRLGDLNVSRVVRGLVNSHRQRLFLQNLLQKHKNEERNFHS